ncbi:MAG: CvpA family protein [Ignavibacteria bacterium]|nr:CvpA family protein [Ignavibacteria bacterium]
MNWLDILIALLVTLPTYFGYRKGFLRKLMGIAGIIVGFILAVKFYGSVASILSSVIKENTTFVNVLAFLLIIGLLYGSAIWLARFIANMNSGTSMIDKILGVVVGFLQGLIVASVLLYNLSLANMPSVEARNSSMLYAPVYKIAPAIFDKIIDMFPGLKDIYDDYKSPQPEQKNSPDSKDPNIKEPQKNSE